MLRGLSRQRESEGTRVCRLHPDIFSVFSSSHCPPALIAQPVPMVGNPAPQPLGAPHHPGRSFGPSELHLYFVYCCLHG